MSYNQSVAQQKLQKLYGMYKATFHYYLQNSKKDSAHQNIKDICSKMDDANNFFLPNLYQLSLVLVAPLEKCNSKIMEMIIDTYDEILRENLVDIKILQKMSEELLAYINKSFSSNAVDVQIYYKILKICILISSHLFINQKSIKFILRICLHIFILTRNIERVQVNPIKAISKVIENFLKYYIPVNYSKNEFSIDFMAKYRMLSPNLVPEKKKEILYELQLNEFKFLSKKYIDFLIDLIEIREKMDNKENGDIVDKYIEAMKNWKHTYLKSNIETLHLESLPITNTIEGTQQKIGKYGWCVFCRKTANYFSQKLYFPICGIHDSACESEFLAHLNNVYTRSIFLSLLESLTNNLNVEATREESGNNAEVYLLSRVFYLEVLREIFERWGQIFSDDIDVVFIVRELFKNSLLKNSMSKNVNVFQVNLDLFLTIIKNFRAHLKDEIEIFFNQVLIVFLESENFPFKFKEAVLNSLANLAQDCWLLVEIYVNFDCDVNCNAIFSELINLLTKIMNGLYKKPKYQSTIKANEETILRHKTFDFFNIFIQNLLVLVENNDKKSNKAMLNNNIENTSTMETKIEQSKNKLINDMKLEDSINGNASGIQNLMLNDSNDSGENENSKNIKDKITKNLKIKKLLERAIELFNIGKSSSDCLKFLQKEKMVFGEEAFNNIKNAYLSDINNTKSVEDYQNLLTPEQHTIISEMTNEDLSSIDTSKAINIMQTPFISNINPLVYFMTNEEKSSVNDLSVEDYTAFEMARFIRSNLKDLKRERVGDYLCSGKPFNIKILTYFINSFEFTGMNILEAMRLLFLELPLAGEAQVIDRVVQKFGEKFHSQNPEELGNPDFCYYLSFSILQLNTDLHREEVEKKMTLKEFIDQLNMSTGDTKINEKYLENLYNTILVEPLIIPGQKLSSSEKNMEKILQKERETIIKSSVTKLQNNNTIINNYITNIRNDNIKHLLEFSWSNFLSIYSQRLADTNNNNTTLASINNIVNTAKICGILKLTTAEEAYLNCLINMTNISEYREITSKNIECIKSILNFITSNGNLISTGWMPILSLISKLNYYINSDNSLLIEDVKNSTRRTKNIEKEISFALQKKDIIIKNIQEMQLEVVFSESHRFNEESIVDFVNGLCKVSKAELSGNHTPGLFALQKLAVVADYNLSRIQAEWVKIWKLIREHLIYVISYTKQEKIWTLTLDSLRQTISKLLQKSDLSIYNFQMDFFLPFEIIFKQTDKMPSRSEMVLEYINYIIGQFSKNIHSGWIIIFKIIKDGLKRRDTKLNIKLIDLLSVISEDKSLFKSFNIDAFQGYVECFCYMFVDKNKKDIAENNMRKVLSNIILNLDSQDRKDHKSRLLNTQVMYKKYTFLKSFLYGFDDLIKGGPIEHLSLLFTLINSNPKALFSEDVNSFLYGFFVYFFPHLITALLARAEKREEEEKLTEELKSSKYYEIFQRYSIPNTEDNKSNIIIIKVDNIKKYLTDYIDLYIKDVDKFIKDFFIHNNEIEKINKSLILEFLKMIKQRYNSHEFDMLLKKKVKDFDYIDQQSYNKSIEFYIENINDMLNRNSLSTDNKHVSLNYISFLSSFLFSLHLLANINKNKQGIYSSLSSFYSKTNNINITDNINVKNNINRNNYNNNINDIQSLNIFLLSFFLQKNIDKNTEKNIEKNEEKININGEKSAEKNIEKNNIENKKKNSDEKDIYKNTENKPNIIPSEFFRFFWVYIKKHSLSLQEAEKVYELSVSLLCFFLSSSSSEDEDEEIEHLEKIKRESVNVLSSSSFVFPSPLRIVLALKKNMNINVVVVEEEMEEIISSLLPSLSSSELKIAFEFFIEVAGDDNPSLRKKAQECMREFINRGICKFEKVNN